MTEENIKNLEQILKDIHEGNYTLLRPGLWDKHTEILSNSGANLLRDIERERAEIHPVKIALISPLSRSKMDKLDNSYHRLLKNYELFFDASMRFLKCFSEEGDHTATKRIYAKQYVEGLLKHSSQAVDHITNLVLKKSTEYKHCQTLFVALFVALVATIIALSSVLISLWALLGRT